MTATTGAPSAGDDVAATTRRGPRVRVAPAVPADVDAVVVAACSDRLGDVAHHAFLASVGFRGRAGDARVLPGADGEPARVVVGLGPSGSVDGPVLRRAAAAGVRAARRYRRVAVALPAADGAVQAVAEAALLGLYRFTAYKSAADGDAVEEIVVVTHRGGDGGSAAAERADAVAGAVALARDLGNEPGGSLTPPAFAERAAAVAAASGLGCDVWDADRIAAERLGGLLGVARGSVQPPRLVRLAYEPAGASRTVALVGKGVTFDSGGLTLKPNSMMLTMKTDMAGAGAVLGAMSAVAAVGAPDRIVAWLPLTDNMSGGDATRLGDVLRTRSGTTVEVRNADAEGRLILADALALAAEESLDAIVDLATLTDSVPMAIGRRYAGLAGNDSSWVAAVQAAAGRAGELVWPFPLDGVERSQLDSKVADLVNATGNRYGQSAIAALFLAQFVPDGLPWAHLDIAGPAFSDDDDGEWTAGATGFGVRTLLELVTGGTAG